MKKLLTSLFASCLLVSCVSGPSISQLERNKENLDYGAYPTNWKLFVEVYLEGNLKDPFSVRNITIYPPKKTIKYLYGENFVGYEILFTYYAKNGYGAYNKGYGAVYARDNHIKWTQ